MEKSISKEFLQGLRDYIDSNYCPISIDRKKRVFGPRNAMAKIASIEEQPVELQASISENRSLDDMIKHLDDTFQQSVFKIIDDKHLDEVDVYNSVHIDRRLFSKLRSDKNFHPSKKTAIALCFGLKLNLDEARDLLKKAGYSFSHSSKSDLIIEYFLKIGEYNINTLNQVMYEYKETEYWF